MNHVPIGKIGFIESGSNKGFCVFVEYDPERTGGYYIYQSMSPDVFSSKEVFDDWIPDVETLEKYFASEERSVIWQT
jgi:hypothetical protein